MVNPKKSAVRAVVRVGHRRGFLINGGRDSLVVTAGHCLPSLPPCANFSHDEERTYKRLLGPLGKKPTIWAECLFVDPVADLAVLGPPDSQSFSGEYWAYKEFVEPLPTLRIRPAPKYGTYEKRKRALLEAHDLLREVRQTTRRKGKTVKPQPLEATCRAWVLSLDQKWKPCAVSHIDGPLCFKEGFCTTTL
jgi:hypothetical protein